MKKVLFLLVALFSFGVLTGDEVPPVHAAEVKKGPKNCSHAHAILGWSNFKKIKGKHGKDEDGNWIDETDEEFQRRIQKPWVKVGWIVGRLNWGRSPGNELLEMVDRYEPGKYGQAQFEEYRVKGYENGKAYVAHCGAGATCNMIAERFYNLYKGIGVPKVVCGKKAMPPVVHGAVKPTIPIPSDEELNAAAEEEDYDDFFAGDDDDDDDSDDDF